MIPGITAGQVMPHRWSGAASINGDGDVFPGFNFGIANISAQFSGAGLATVFATNLNIIAQFAGVGSLAALARRLRPIAADFDGAGNFSANAEFISPIKEGSALFFGAGGLASLSRLVHGVSATLVGAGRFPGLWSPSMLSTLVGWWDASDVTTLTDAGSGHCSQWNDKSSNANHVTQATDAKRPIITSSGINGLTTLTFASASSQLLEKLAASGLPNLAAGIGCGVVVWATDTVNRGIWDISDTTNTNRTALMALFSTTLNLRALNASASSIAFSDTSAPHLFSGTISTALRDVYLDGTQGTSNSTVQTNVSSTNLRIGQLFQNVFPMEGQIGEVVFFSASAAVDRQRVEGYLAWKWGLQANLPGAHPYASTPPLSTSEGTYPSLFTTSAAFSGAGRFFYEGYNTVTIFNKTLASSGTIAVNLSFRQIVTPLSAGGNFVRVSFKAGNSTYGLTNASIGVQSTTYNTTATPVELLFSGVSGFSISAGQTIVSDWTPITFTSSDKLIVIGDAGAAGGTEAFANSGVTGCLFYSKTSTNSYNVASPAGTWSLQSNVDVIPKIDAST